MDVNPTKEKKLTNMRQSSGDVLVPLIPHKQLSMEQALEFCREDECVEVTPATVRIRKVNLDADRARSGGRPGQEAAVAGRPRLGHESVTVGRAFGHSMVSGGGTHSLGCHSIKRPANGDYPRAPQGTALRDRRQQRRWREDIRRQIHAEAHARRRRPRAVVAASLILAACGSSDSSSSTDNGGGSGGPTGSITVDGSQPENPLIPTATNETGGGNVVDAMWTGLVSYNIETGKPENAMAESIESSDNTNWTIKIKPGWKFQDGTVVTAKSYVDAWNCGAYGPNGQHNNYFFAPIEGYDAMNPAAAADGTTPKPTVKTLTGLRSSTTRRSPSS